MEKPGSSEFGGHSSGLQLDIGGLDDLFAEALKVVEKHAHHAEEAPVPTDDSPFALSHTDEPVSAEYAQAAHAHAAHAQAAHARRAPAERGATDQAFLRTLQHERELEHQLIERLKARTAELTRDVQRLEQALQEKTAEATRLTERLGIAGIELEGIRRRTTREKLELERYGTEKLLKDMLPVIDNLERALQHAKDSPDISVMQEGIQMTHTQFLACLKRHGVSRIELSPGAAFDPNHHEAMMHEEVPGLPPHAVARELQGGYTHHERLLRASLVSVTRPTNA